MNKIAVMDIGSNSVRLMTIADGKVLYKTLTTTRLGEGLAFSSRLKNEAMERTLSALSAFCERAKAEGARATYAFATAAVRSAENGKEFLELVRERCGLNVELISGEEEAEIGILGALGEKDGTILDIGGASTELIVRENGRIVYEKSLDIGVVRIKDLCGREKTKTEEVGRAMLEKFDAPRILSPVYAIGGTVTTLAAIVLKLPVYEGNKVTGVKITQECARELADRLFSASVEEIERISCVDKLRADVIAGGAQWLYTIMEGLGIDEVFASDGDNLEGFAISRRLLAL